MTDKETQYGKITVGYGSSTQKELQIMNFVQATYKDNRIISICEIEDGSFSLSVENLPSSGRATQQTMWLSKESFIGLLTTSLLYLERKNIDLLELTNQIVKDKTVNFNCSKDLLANKNLPK